MPRVSVCIPAYNRADTVLRTLRSVQAQTFDAWEVVVVDDGSTDGTADVVRGLGDPRIRVVSQANQGLPGARNTAVREARCDVLAFHDSDDEWPPHHLALAMAFLDAHPDAAFCTSEVWDHFANGTVVKHFRAETGEWYPRTAARIGARGFRGPPPCGDPYLHVYPRRSDFGAWGREIVERSGYHDAHHYQGDIFEHWRWGWLHSMQPTVARRTAVEAVGPHDTSLRAGADYEWLVRLNRRFPAHFFSLPGCFWRDSNEAGKPVASGHISHGNVRLYEDFLVAHRRFFHEGRPPDRELDALIAYQEYLTAHVAAQTGQREKALAHLARSREAYGGADALLLGLLLRAAPSDALCASACRISERSLQLADAAMRRARAMWARSPH